MKITDLIDVISPETEITVTNDKEVLFEGPVDDCHEKLLRCDIYDIEIVRAGELRIDILGVIE